MQNLETEVLIIGGGAAGMAAATAVSELGKKALIVEANASVGGNGLFPRGIFAVDSVLQRQKLIFADKDQVFRDCMNYSHWRIDGRIIRTLIEKSGDTIEWLMGKGVEFDAVVHHIPNQAPEVFHTTSAEENVGRVVIRNLKAFCEAHQVEIRTKTRGEHLIKNEEGDIVGAVCVDAQGEEVRIDAKKVIVCCGGFAGNEDMIREYYPNFHPEQVEAGPGMRHMGEGLKMAMEAGADLDGNFTMEIAAPKIKGFVPLNLILGKPYNVWLNAFGERFADESIVYNFAVAANACERQLNGEMWVVFDQGILDMCLADGPDHIEKIHVPPEALAQLDACIEDAISEGVLCRSDKISDIADFIGATAEDVEDCIAEYNAFCHSGRDGIFAKEQRYLKPLVQGPYYAIHAGRDMLITHGGIRVNERFQALDAEHLPLANLFIAGVDFGGADAEIYNVVMSGHGFGFALNSGRMAGENAVAELNLENAV